MGTKFYDVFVSPCPPNGIFLFPFFAFGSFRSIICALFLPARLGTLVVAIYLPMGLFMFVLIIHQVSVQWVEGICKSMMGLNSSSAFSETMLIGASSGLTKFHASMAAAATIQCKVTDI